jgi:broad specificity phosphatase PhoE
VLFAFGTVQVVVPRFDARSADDDVEADDEGSDKKPDDGLGSTARQRESGLGERRSHAVTLILESIHAGGILARTITLVRHAETVSNIAGTWQGQTDSPLSDRGRLQVERLRDRMDGPWEGLLVVSDLGRTRTTASVIGTGEALTEWREFDLGAWDGLRPEEIRARYPEVDRVRFGSGDFQPDGGERFSDFKARIHEAFDTVAARMDDDDHATVVTHGGVIQTIIGLLLGTADQSVILVPSNASLTTVRLDGDDVQVSVFNDDLHLNGGVVRPPGARLRLIRHGQTLGNLEGRWWGRGETPLSEQGRRQAAMLANVVGPFDTIVSSPLSRARDTAEPVAAAQDKEVTIVEGFAEFDFGEWEGLSIAEIMERDGEMFRHIHIEGNDEPRGRIGETFTGVGERMAAAAEQVVSNGDGTVGVFTHGGATRAYASLLLGIPFADRERLPIPRNTAHMELIWVGDGPRLSSYNVAAHLGT